MPSSLSSMLSKMTTSCGFPILLLRVPTFALGAAMPQPATPSSRPACASGLPSSVLSRRPALKRFEGKPLILGIRPEDLEDAALAGGAPPERRLSAVVDIREDMGSEVFVHFGIGGKPVVGEDVRAAVGEDAADVKGSTWVARVDRDTQASEEHQIKLAVDTNRLHFFDPATGEAIYD